LSPMTPHPHRCCCCYPLRDTMLQCEHPLSGSRPSGTEYDCMHRCHILPCTPWCVYRSACSISSSDAGSPRVFHPCYLVPPFPLPLFQRPQFSVDSKAKYSALSSTRSQKNTKTNKRQCPFNTDRHSESHTVLFVVKNSKVVKCSWFAKDRLLSKLWKLQKCR